MKTRSTMRPGAPGTKRFLARYGERLISVRYVYDLVKKKRYTTVELIAEESAWNPYRWGLREDTEVPVRAEVREGALEREIRVAGGRWDRGRRVWWLPYGRVAAMGLEERIVFTPAELEQKFLECRRRPRSIAPSTDAE
ncbi:MAG: hypothetical protein IT186_03965 [Acidobacteria bacterium]|nr:hypothetical protein [Acidobacteriota bacterium]